MVTNSNVFQTRTLFLPKQGLYSYRTSNLFLPNKGSIPTKQGIYSYPTRKYILSGNIQIHFNTIIVRPIFQSKPCVPLTFIVLPQQLYVLLGKIYYFQ